MQAYVFSFMTLRDATLLPFERPLATPLGILTSSHECYITWESQTRNKTPISAINTHVKYACIRFFVSSIHVSPKVRECGGKWGSVGAGCSVAAVNPPQAVVPSL